MSIKDSQQQQKLGALEEERVRRDKESKRKMAEMQKKKEAKKEKVIKRFLFCPTNLLKRKKQF